MKKIIETFIRKRNPSFKFDSKIDNSVLLSLFVSTMLCLVRGWFIFLLHLKKPGLIFLDRRVRFFNIKNIEIGNWTKIGTGVFLSALGRERLDIGRSVSIGAYSQIIISTSFNNLGKYIRIGNNVGIGQFASLGGSGGLTIGNDTIIGQYFSCHPENHIFESKDLPIRNQGTARAPIDIGNNCWIGAKVTILAGVTIGDNSIIAAGAVVNKSMPPNSIIGGVPARLIRER